ncbi:uncharacterized protein TNCV_3243551 [Trichonephila clavipes]|nr:uncharacterized protein TNCV_3243551 [Trichonephila clavipes]
MRYPTNHVQEHRNVPEQHLSCWNRSPCIAANGMSSRNSVKTSLRNTKYDCPDSRSGNRYGPSRRSPRMPDHTLRDQRS